MVFARDHDAGPLLAMFTSWIVLLLLHGSAPSLA